LLVVVVVLVLVGRRRFEGGWRVLLVLVLVLVRERLGMSCSSTGRYQRMGNGRGIIERMDARMNDRTVVMGWTGMGGLERVGDERVLGPRELLHHVPLTSMRNRTIKQVPPGRYALERKVTPIEATM
jgi:hypothetical protein